MPTNFPTSVDNFTNPTANDSLNLPSHSTQHANANDAIEAIETTLFTGGINYTGLIHLNTTTFTTQSSVAIDNIFTTAYNNYVLQIAYAGTNAQGLKGVWRTNSSTDVTSGYYWGAVATNAGSGPSRASGLGVANFELGVAGTGTGGTMHVSNIGDIALASSTKHQWSNFAQFGAELEAANGGTVNINATAYAGIRFYVSTGTITGTARIYGVRNS